MKSTPTHCYLLFCSVSRPHKYVEWLLREFHFLAKVANRFGLVLAMGEASNGPPGSPADFASRMQYLTKFFRFVFGASDNPFRRVFGLRIESRCQPSYCHQKAVNDPRHNFGISPEQSRCSSSQSSAVTVVDSDECSGVSRLYCEQNQCLVRSESSRERPFRVGALPSSRKTAVAMQ
jgi:hypothetical protein